jgi:hypothetical protein
MVAGLEPKPLSKAARETVLKIARKHEELGDVLKRRARPVVIASYPSPSRRRPRGQQPPRAPLRSTGTGRAPARAREMPFVYVNYEGDISGPFTDRLQSSNVHERSIMFGFDLKATYDFGDDYQYDHVWRFHEDGQFGATIVIQGPGEEIHGRHTYHLPFRFDLDVSGNAGDSFESAARPAARRRLRRRAGAP